MLTRRNFLQLGSGIFGSSLLPASPLPKKHVATIAAKAKSIIYLVMNGGQSQVDTWDYKPALSKYEGKSLKGMNQDVGFFPNKVGSLMQSPFSFKQYGESGKWVSELFPNLATQVDKMCFIHSCYTKSNNHSPALFQINTGENRMGFPCLGAWIQYGLHSLNNNLPGFVVMTDARGRGLPKGTALNWGAGFLPGSNQGTPLRNEGPPISNLMRPFGMSKQRQAAMVDAMKSLYGVDLNSSRIDSFELALRMQESAPQALNVDREPAYIKNLYGYNDPVTKPFAKQCLLARRLVERGVRCIQIYSGGTENQKSWDGHKDIKGNHSQFAMETDRPIAALLTDLEARGLLDETLVVYGSEFGRLPVAEKGKVPGRDHNPDGFTYWFAGGGVKHGFSYGSTDEVGYKAVEKRVSVHELHATILHLLGIDHEKLTYKYQGLETRLTGVDDVEIISDIII